MIASIYSNVLSPAQMAGATWGMSGAWFSAGGTCVVFCRSLSMLLGRLERPAHASGPLSV